MTQELAAVLERFGVGLARLHGDRVVPCNEQMRDALAAAGGDDLSAFGCDGAVISTLRGGALIDGGAACLQLVQVGGEALLLRFPAETGTPTAHRRALLLSRLATGLMHDLGNQLNGAIGLADLVLEQTASADEQRMVRAMSLAVRNGSSLLRVLVELLQSSPRKVQSCNLREVVQSAAMLITKSAQKGGLSFAVAGEVPDVAIRMGLDTALQNVLSCWLLSMHGRRGAQCRLEVLDGGAPGRPGSRATVDLALIDHGDGAPLRPLVELLHGDPLLYQTRHCVDLPGAAMPAIEAALSLRRHGGDLVLETSGDERRFILRLPLPRSPRSAANARPADPR